MDFSMQEYIVAGIVLVCVIIVIRKIYRSIRRSNDSDNPCSTCGCGCGSTKGKRISITKPDKKDKISPNTHKNCDC